MIYFRFRRRSGDEARSETWIDGRGLSLDALMAGLGGRSEIEGKGIACLESGRLEAMQLSTSFGMVPMSELFEIEIEEDTRLRSVLDGEVVLILEGDFRRVDGLCSGTSFGTTFVCGDVGDRFGEGQRGGNLVLLGDAGGDALSGKRDGLALLVGSVGDGFASPAPGELSGLRGGDSFVFGNVGGRACERMRRGSVFLAGDVGEYLAHRWIAGTIYVDGSIGRHWCAGMRRGSLLLRQEQPHGGGATLTRTRKCELSFLPILWKYVRDLLKPWSTLDLPDDILDGQRGVGLRESVTRFLDRLPNGPRALRCFGDVECEGQGEVLYFFESVGLDLANQTAACIESGVIES
jgi:formylmethanofuran dehydrogenase subunit C